MFNKIVPHLFLGDYHDYELLSGMIGAIEKPYIFVDARPFYNLLQSDANGKELMVFPLRTLAFSLAKLVEANIDVYIYCQAGMERSPFLTAIVLFYLDMGSLAWCYNYVKTKRPETLIYDTWTKHMAGVLFE